MRIFPISLSLMALCAIPAHAQVDRPSESWGGTLVDEDGEYLGQVDGARPVDADRIVVLASGQWQRMDENGQAISVLDAAELETVQGPDITRALQRLAGVSLTRNGGIGSFTGLSVRGSASERVLVLVDGVRMNDVAGPAGGFDFGTVVSGGIERVELLRGPGSLVWGSDALGGVVNLTTRVPDGVEASGEYGGDEQFSGNFALGQVDIDGLTAGIGASYVTRGGFSAAEGGSEDDGFEQLALSARGEANITDGFSAFARARYAAGETEIDGFPPPFFVLADTAERQDTRQLSARGGVEYGFGENSLVTFSLGRGETRRELVDESFSSDPYYTTNGDSTRAELRGRLGLTRAFYLLAGGDWEWTSFADDFGSASTDSGSGYAMLGWLREDSRDIGFSAGLRVDRHRDFGSTWTFAANGFAELSEQLRVRAAYGEGFKAPSLFQLHSDFGNPLLGPERSRSYEAGLELWLTRRGARTASVTVFRRDSRGLIDFVSCFGMTGGICANRPFGTYDNVGRARSEGVEVEARHAILPGLEAGLAYAYTDSVNRDTGRDLPRRPHHAGTLTLDWEVVGGALFLGGDLRVVSGSFDNAWSSMRMDGYELFDLRARYVVGERLEFYGRVENAWDEQYQTAAGYATQGRAAFVGVRARL